MGLKVNLIGAKMINQIRLTKKFFLVWAVIRIVGHGHGLIVVTSSFGMLSLLLLLM